MGRKNSRAGQPNRQAQMFRRAARRATQYRDERALGPQSEHLIHEGKPQGEVVMREKVIA